MKNDLCPHCKEGVPEGSRFCLKCFSRLTEVEQIGYPKPPKPPLKLHINRRMSSLGCKLSLCIRELKKQKQFIAASLVFLLVLASASPRFFISENGRNFAVNDGKGSFPVFKAEISGNGKESHNQQNKPVNSGSNGFSDTPDKNFPLSSGVTTSYMQDFFGKTEKTGDDSKSSQSGTSSGIVSQSGIFPWVSSRSGTSSVVSSPSKPSESSSDTSPSSSSPSPDDTKPAEPTVFAGGDGSAANPYKLSTPAHLNEVRNYLDKHFIQINDIYLSSWGNWNPIGSGSTGNAFSGTYDGGNYVIKGLNINISGIAYAPVGLFGYNKGVIKNLGMVDSNIYVSAKQCDVGGIVGNSFGDGTVTNCYNTGTVTAVSADYGVDAGGIVGANGGNGGNPKIFDCYNTGVISGTSASYSACVGGITGGSYNGYLNGCYNLGNITATVTNRPYSSVGAWAGGIAGANSNKDISNSYNIGNVSANTTYVSSRSDLYAGGIIGHNSSGKIDKCYNIGKISMSASLGNRSSGGIVGINTYSGTVTNSYFLNNYGSSYGTVLTDTQMKSKSSFTGWDFVNVWKIDSGKNNGYPELI